MANSEKMNNRMRLGDKRPMEVPAAQPIPGLPQDQKAGNSQNYEAIDVSGNMGQVIGQGPHAFPYGDMSAQGHPATGNSTFVTRSQMNQNKIPGKGLNIGFEDNYMSPQDAEQLMAKYPSLTMQGTVASMSEPDSGQLIPGSTKTTLGKKNKGIA